MALADGSAYRDGVIDAPALSALLSGLLFGLSLIVAIGPQNAFVVRQGALRRHVPVVVAICAASDIVLIAAGVSGTGAALAGRPWLLEVTRSAGAAVLLAYAALAARRALNASAIERAHEPAGAGRTAAIAACLAFTWLTRRSTWTRSSCWARSPMPRPRASGGSAPAQRSAASCGSSRWRPRRAWRTRSSPARGCGARWTASSRS